MKKNSEESGSEKVVIGTLVRAHSKFVKRPTIIILAVFLIAALIAIRVVANNANQKKEKTPDLTKVKALVESNDCSTIAQKSVSKEQPSTSQPEASIWLLNYKASCLVRSGYYKQANTLYKELEGYYSANHDAAAMSNVEQQIAEDNYAAANPPPPRVSGPQALSPSEAKRINDFLRGSQ